MQIKLPACLHKLQIDNTGGVSLVLEIPESAKEYAIKIPPMTELDITINWEG